VLALYVLENTRAECQVSQILILHVEEQIRISTD
jgi:hypothetical protein